MFDGKSLDSGDRTGCRASVEEALEAMHVGFSIFDAELLLVTANKACLRLLDLPPELGRAGTPLEAIFRFNAARGEYGEGDAEAQVEERLTRARKFEAHSFRHHRPDGTVLEVTGEPLASGGFVTTYVDVTEATRAQEALQDKEKELTRYLEDIDLERAMVEQQAGQVVEMAEQLSVQNKEIEESRKQSDFQARHDELTGLPNRRYFTEFLEQALLVAGQAGTGKALLFIDLDNFKPVNDILGHDEGDALLKKVALRLTSGLRDSDFVARLGGDEFAVIAGMRPGSSIEGIRLVAERLLEALNITIEEAEPPITVAASIGIALFPDDAAGHDELLKQADQAMYEAKATGRSRIVFASQLAEA
ncbi:diguanylate cyclase domain-containing protein [Pelagibius marinus]|uniref:diguanylate cyclase domain-containing protein n=1 Tax=Pelagibius marinus TaxID=2762760 RepID=UPI0018728775|nr:diguanylate cyclase [Pelagibius marinus]